MGSYLRRPAFFVAVPLVAWAVLAVPARTAGQVHAPGFHGTPMVLHSAFRPMPRPGMSPAFRPRVFPPQVHGFPHMPGAVNRPFVVTSSGFQFRPVPHVPHHVHVNPRLHFRRELFEFAVLARALGLLSPPVVAVNPFAQLSPFWAGYGSMYAGSGLYGGYGAMMAPAYMGSYPYPYSVGAAYSNPFASYGYGNSSQGYGSGATADQPKQQDKRASFNLFDALGVPNDGSRLTWPLGLRILPPATESQTRLRQIDALVQLMAKQATAGGQVSANTLQEARRAAEQLHALLRDRKDALTSANTFNEADRFLTQLERGLKALQY
jgi:hypothetical protein